MGFDARSSTERGWEVMEGSRVGDHGGWEVKGWEAMEGGRPWSVGLDLSQSQAHRQCVRRKVTREGGDRDEPSDEPEECSMLPQSQEGTT